MIYIHVPFCKSRCLYCDFFSSTAGHLKQDYVRALCREMDARGDEISRARADTLYIGGGTPSQLDGEQLLEIFSHLESVVCLEKDAEVTIEVNPDDVTPGFVELLRQTPVNRVSMGVQSLDDGILRLINRRHTARQARRAVELLRDGGYGNVSLDLMYGLPLQTLDMWRHDVDELLGWGVPHLSAYALQWEEGTALWRMRERGEVAEADEELSCQMYDYLLDATHEAGMVHYEISNFAIPGREARHNSGYWREDAYVGLGPGAHSYDGVRTRKSNPDDLIGYCQTFSPIIEILDDDELYDELVMKRLRTGAGLCMDEIPEKFRSHAEKMAEPHIRGGRMVFEEGVFRLTRAGIFTSNDIMSDMMF